MIKFLPFLIGVLPASGTVITFQELSAPTGTYTHISQDFRGNGATSNASNTLVGYQTAGVLEIRTVMSFGLSAIPAGSTINSISLRLVSDGNQSGTIAGVGTLNLHEIIPNGVAANNMVEGQISRLIWKTGTNWTNAGGDFNGTAMSSATLDNANANTTLDAGETATFGTSAAFVLAAQAAFDAGLPIEFIIIAPTAEATTGSSHFFRFRSDDFTTTAGDRPLLTIDYTIPEPGTATLAFSALAATFLLRRRSA